MKYDCEKGAGRVSYGLSLVAVMVVEKEEEEEEQNVKGPCGVGAAATASLL